MAVVKADAYGHGAVACAHAAASAGATQLAVARLDEALTLRNNSISLPILVLGWIPPARLVDAVRANVAVCIWSCAQLRDVARAAQTAAAQRAAVHVKFNSGMTRLGVDSLADLTDLAAELRASAATVRWDGLFTHMASGDAADAAPTLEQLDRFGAALRHLSARQLLPASTLVHAANSATAMRFPAARFDMLRVGIALYGLAPCANETPAPPGVLPALSWYASVAQRRTLARGTPVSYGGTYRAQWDGEQHVTIAVGYADGFRRCANNKVVLGGVECDVVGRVTMDNIVARIPRGAEAQTANCTVAELISDARPADAVARVWNTINYEVVCAIGKRVPQLY